MTPVLKLLPIAIANNLGREGGGGGGLPSMGGGIDAQCGRLISYESRRAIGGGVWGGVAFGGGCELALDGGTR